MSEKDWGVLTLFASADYVAPLGFAIAALEKEREHTKEVTGGLSIQDLDIHIEGFPNSIGSLLYHIADIELDWLYSEILEEEIPKSLMSLFPVVHRDEKGKLSVIANQSLAEHFERLTIVRNELLTKLKGVDEAEFYRVRNFERYDVNPAWVLYHLLEHECKHSEQIAHICRQLK